MLGQIGRKSRSASGCKDKVLGKNSDTPPNGLIGTTKRHEWTSRDSFWCV